MQAVEVIEITSQSESDKEKRSLAFGLYLSLVVFTIKEFEAFHRSIAFQVFEVPQDSKHAVAIYPSEIENLHKLDQNTTWTIEFHINTSIEKMHEALIANTRISELVLAIMARFANKYSLSYNSSLEVESFHNLKLIFELRRILSNE